mmetsp:Transcript_13666/g.48214  ORF Transcript_13666/g.48214 Transcript_13666/m.48214 type:complete len:471 (-) Transcript_13666:57-1469(-)|eukprot:CAMPEP_0204161670 /NCGR_PEP_ID=MMETSP0361-20130328/34919_1 /ASSEMBLY_ACC=CAM_ASM_000343 /TAXON_ID=268821 /ORGANISM="Scrippsiella Hangoei, Strain SHTV-5" /LENGTH=470 /DNA_ID=CAMNT_0051118141 /DNA_START=49 /DNA_END=1461 /DNA_ORIENTATION=-
MFESFAARWSPAVALLILLLRLAAGAAPLPRNQADFFDLLPAEYPWALPSVGALDPVAGRLAAACSSAKDLVTLAVAASELHSMTLTPTGYDLSLPDFDGTLAVEEWQHLRHTCQLLANAYMWTHTLALELAALCPEKCRVGDLGSLLMRAKSGCHSWLSELGVDGGDSHALRGDLAHDLTSVARRAQARNRQVLEAWCEPWLASVATTSLSAPHAEVLGASRAVAGEVRIFLDHTFHALSFGQAGFQSMQPLDGILAQHSPSLQHVPVAGQRWDVVRGIFEDLARANGDRGLRVAEIGVEKGMTVTFLMRTVPSIREYVLVDPWHIPGKPDEFNAMLEGYSQNLQSWSANEPSFQRDGTSAVRVLRMTSQEAAAQFQDGYFDAVFIDAEHTFQEVQRDIATWKRRVRSDGGVVAGHDFSIFHPAVALAVLLECGPAGNDLPRFPLESRDGRPLLNLAVDSVWWCVRTRE